MPFRVFAAGEVLTAANVNDYLAEQAISTFAGTAARASAITAPTEGQFAYLSDTDTLTFYNGSAWVNAGSAIAGTALSSGTATSGQVLTANGSGAVTFSTPTQGLTLLKTYTMSAVSSLSFDNNTFTSTYDNYVIWFYTTANSNANFQIRLRSGGTDASGASYDRTGYTATSTGGPSSFSAQGESTGIIGALGLLNRCSAVINIYLPYQTQYTHWTSFVVSTNNTSPYLRFDNVTGQYGVVASYDSATLYPSSGTLTGSVSVFGVNK